MKLFVGLGNPGAKYEKTRHNIGFLAIDAIADAHGFPPARSKFQGRLTEGRLGTGKALLLKPETFMNLSGQSVGEAMRFYKLSPDDVTVFHDELDLAPGKIRVKTGGGHAGHNGLRSMHEHVGAEFHRVRIGIGHPGDKRLVSNYVLHDFAKADWDWVDPLLDAMAAAAPSLVSGDAAGFMNAVALKARPPQPPASAKPTATPTEKTAGLAPRATGPMGDKADAKSGEPAQEQNQEAAKPLSPLQKLAARFSRS